MAIYDAIVDAAIDMVPEATGAAPYFLQSGRLVLRATRGADGRPGISGDDLAAKELAAAAAHRGQSVFTSGSDGARQALPLEASNRIVGVMLLSYLGAPNIENGDSHLLQRLNVQAAAAIATAWSFETGGRRVQELTALHSVAVAAAAAVDEDALIEQTTKIIGAELFPDGFGVMLLGARTAVLRRHPSYRRGPTRYRGCGCSVGKRKRGFSGGYRPAETSFGRTRIGYA